MLRRVSLQRGSVALGGVGVAYRVDVFARAAPRDACCRRHPCRLACAGAARSVSAEGLFDFLFGGVQKQQQRQAPRAGEFLRRSVRPQPAARTAAAPSRRGSGPAFCVRSCDGKYFPLTARQRLAGSDVPGVLPGERHQGVFRQQHRRRVLGNWRALCRQRKRLRLSQGAARRLHLQRPRPRRAGAGRSHARHLAALRRRDRHHRRAGGLFRRPARRRPDRGIHPGCVLSRPHRRCPRPARRNEGGAGQRRNGRRQRAAAGSEPRRRAARRPRCRRRSRPERSARK